MASKSKRRGRVFRASCILAALIIAGSSFAWFTSKDEVTNRLTASSDYGVSIVESFTPPKNWLPGETVNKDVYAVNTGSIDAYVKEDVKGYLTYSYEDLMTTWVATRVKLTLTQVAAIEGQTQQDGATTYEAGGYLAWTDAPGVETGSINSGKEQDITTPWKPTETGAYIFRRSVNYDPTTNQQNDANPFKYAGYYAVVTKDDPSTTDVDESNVEYYKIVIGNDTYPTQSETAHEGVPYREFVYDIYVDANQLGIDVANNIDKKTGEISEAPSYKWVDLKEVNSTPVSFKYEPKADSGKTYDRLVVEFNAATPVTTVDGVTYDANAYAARMEVDYNNKLGVYDATLDSYNNAVANYNYAKALATAKNELITARDTVKAAYEALNGDGTNAGSQSEYETARDNVNNYAQDMLDGTTNVITPAANRTGIMETSSTTDIDIKKGATSLAPNNASGGIMTSEEMDAYNGDPAANPYVTGLTAYKDAFKAYSDIFNEIYTDGDNPYTTAVETDYESLYTQIETLLNDIKGLSDNPDAAPTNDADTAKEKVTELKQKVAQLKSRLTALQQAYFNFEDATNNVTGLALGGNSTAAETALTEILGAADKLIANTNSLDGLIDTYVTKEHDKEEDERELQNAEDAWESAVDKYNNDVKDTPTTSADAVYQAALDAIDNADHYDTNNDTHNSQDKRKPIVYNYSANQLGYNGGGTAFDPVSDATDPRIDATFAKGDTAGTPNYMTMNIGTKTNLATTFTDVDTNENTDFSVTNEIGASSGTATTIKAWATALTSAEADMNSANAAYQAAMQTLQNGSGIKLYVNLAPEIDSTDFDASTWTFDESTDNTTDVAFYLNKILLAGETSSKLIDSVEFDKDVSASDYKNLQFDLKVGLDSIQVTYDADQRGYTTDTVNSAANFNMDATVTTPLTEGSAVTWDARG